MAALLLTQMFVAGMGTNVITGLLAFSVASLINLGNALALPDNHYRNGWEKGSWSG